MSEKVTFVFKMIEFVLIHWSHAWNVRLDPYNTDKATSMKRLFKTRAGWDPAYPASAELLTEEEVAQALKEREATWQTLIGKAAASGSTAFDQMALRKFKEIFLTKEETLRKPKYRGGDGNRRSEVFWIAYVENCVALEAYKPETDEELESGVNKPADISLEIPVFLVTSNGGRYPDDDTRRSDLVFRNNGKLEGNQTMSDKSNFAHILQCVRNGKSQVYCRRDAGVKDTIGVKYFFMPIVENFIRESEDPRFDLCSHALTNPVGWNPDDPKKGDPLHIVLSKIKHTDMQDMGKRCVDDAGLAKLNQMLARKGKPSVSKLTKKEVVDFFWGSTQDPPKYMGAAPGEKKMIAKPVLEQFAKGAEAIAVRKMAKSMLTGATGAEHFPAGSGPVIDVITENPGKFGDYVPLLTFLENVVIDPDLLQVVIEEHKLERVTTNEEVSPEGSEESDEEESGNDSEATETNAAS